MSPDRRAPLERDGHVVVVGAGLGGLRCAEMLRTLGHTGPVTLVGDEVHAPYDRPPLTKQFLAGDWDDDKVTLATAARLTELGIDHVAGVAATSLDTAGRTVSLASGDELHGDAVVLATGARPRWLPGTEGATGVHVVRTIEQSASLRDELARLGAGGRVVVVGGGFIGAEVASTAAAESMRVTIVEAMAVPLATVVGELVGGWVASLHREAGIDVRAGVPIESVTGAGASAGPAVTLATGERIDADVVVLGIGVSPSTAWLDDSGLTIDNGVVTDASLFAADGVVAIGDLARFDWHHAGTVEQVRIEHWEVTAQLASVAAHSLVAGRDDAPRASIVPYFWSDQHGRKLQMLGRPSGTDEATRVAGGPSEGRFTVLYHRQGRLTGVLGLASPRNVMRCRTLVDVGAPLDEALALFADA